MKNNLSVKHSMSSQDYSRLNRELELAEKHAAGQVDSSAFKRIVPRATSADVREARSRVHLSQRAFAEVLGCSPATIRAWEQGKREPDGMSSKVIRVIKNDPSLISHFQAA